MAGKRLDREETREKVLKALREGASLKRAAQASGVHPDTFRRYRDECSAEGATEHKYAFFVAVLEAQAEGYMANLDVVNDIRSDDTVDPQYRLKALEMLFRMSGDLSGPGGPSVSVDLGEDGRPTRIRASSGAELKDLTDDELVVEHERLTKGGA